MALQADAVVARVAAAAGAALVARPPPSTRSAVRADAAAGGPDTAEMTDDEKRAVLRDVLRRDPALFLGTEGGTAGRRTAAPRLIRPSGASFFFGGCWSVVERWGQYVDRESVQYFAPLEGDYEVRFHLSRIRCGAT